MINNSNNDDAIRQQQYWSQQYWSQPPSIHGQLHDLVQAPFPSSESLERLQRPAPQQQQQFDPQLDYQLKYQQYLLFQQQQEQYLQYLQQYQQYQQQYQHQEQQQKQEEISGSSSSSISTIQPQNNIDEFKAILESLPIQLKPNQIPHFQKCLELIALRGFFSDTSKAGTGKTVVVGSVQCVRQYPNWIIISPKSVVPNWEFTEKTCGLQITLITTYEALRSTVGHQPKYGLLIRKDYPRDSKSSVATAPHRVEFEATVTWEELCSRGAFLVFDEIQKIKNDSIQQKACRTLIQTVSRHRSTSAFALLSGTPFDKKEHCVNFLRLIGWIQSYGQVTADDLHQLILICQQLQNPDSNSDSKDSKELTKFVAAHSLPRSYEERENFVFDLFVQFILPKIASAMSSPQLDVTIDVKNGFYSFKDSHHLKKQLEEYISLLASSVKYNPRHKENGRKEIEYNRKSFGQMMEALVGISSCKLPILKRLALQDLKSNPHCKVILLLVFKQHIHWLASELAAYSPLILNGETPQHEREVINAKFQQDSDDYRVLLGHLKVAGTGVNLHDTHGNRPRRMYVIPTYELLDLHQACYRILREGSKSPAFVRFIYGKTDAQELPILNAIARKSQVLKPLVPQQVQDKVLFPGDYENEIEN